MSPLAILERSFRPLVMPVMPDDNPSGLCGVYLLIERDVVVYVGSSDSISISLYCHARGDRFFDRAMWFPVPNSVCVYYRAALVRALLPKYNTVRLYHRDHDAEILHGLGLRSSLSVDEIDWLEVA